MKVLAHYRPNTQQRGGVLVMFVLLVFGLMAIAALVIDIGMASATQGQMQAAVDSAALEAMRGRNTLNNGVPDHIEVIPFFFEDDRRGKAAEMIRLSFDDDLQLGADEAGYTVGPAFEVNGGVGDADAFGLIEVGGNVELDDPPIQLNQGGSAGFNWRGGDLVAGTFDPLATHVEASDYTRDDFTPADSFLAANESTAFLVRMRRTGETSEPGASWIGPAIPYLFGRGSLMRGDGSSTPRKDGISVRATAIATAQPALQVGRHVDGPQGTKRGIAKYALEWTAWRDIDVTLNDPACVMVVANELFLVASETAPGPGGPTSPEPVLIGRLMDPLPSLRASKVGQRVDVQVATLPDPEPSESEVWVPLYANVLGIDRVIGFAYAEIGSPEQGGCTTDSFAFSKRASDVASDNASAVFPSSAEDLTKAEWNELFRLRRELVEHPRGEPLLAPALSR